MNIIEEHYNKFNEDKRLQSRHGQVEHIITLKYIYEMIEVIKAKRIKETGTINIPNSSVSILDIGAGTGAYSVPLAMDGYDVSAIELVKHNLTRMKQKCDKIKARQGNALNLKKYPSDSFDIVLLFGPMYHLFSMEEKLQALAEAKRVMKPDGILMVAYLMNDYGIVMYALKEGHLLDCYNGYRLDEDFHCHSKEEDLYDFVSVDDINSMNEKQVLHRIKLITPDGPANYIRPVLKNMTDQEFDIFVKYVESIAERQDMIGAAAHTVDILQK